MTIHYQIREGAKAFELWSVAKRDDGPSFFWECRQDAAVCIARQHRPDDWEIIKVREVMEEDA